MSRFWKAHFKKQAHSWKNTELTSDRSFNNFFSSDGKEAPRSELNCLKGWKVESKAEPSDNLNLIPSTVLFTQISFLGPPTNCGNRASWRENVELSRKLSVCLLTQGNYRTYHIHLGYQYKGQLFPLKRLYFHRKDIPPSTQGTTVLELSTKQWQQLCDEMLLLPPIP